MCVVLWAHSLTFKKDLRCKFLAEKQKLFRVYAQLTMFGGALRSMCVPMDAMQAGSFHARTEKPAPEAKCEEFAYSIHSSKTMQNLNNS